MGVFDTVIVECPKCRHSNDLQSKGADYPSLSIYTLDNVPSDVLSDIDRHAPHSCIDCGTRFEIKLIPTVIVVDS